MKAILEAPGEPQESFAALAAAVHPAWHQAIIRLANVSERMCERLGWVLDHSQDNDPASEYAKNYRELVDMMIEYLDGIDPDPDLEPSFGSVAYGYGAQADECEPPEDTEPSLGSPDRSVDQTRWSAGSKDDHEHDDCDDEPSLGSIDPSMWRGDQTRWAAGDRRDLEDDPTESGIADHDGVLEQIGSGDWTHTVMA